MGDLVVIHGFFQPRLIANISGNDIDLILDVFDQRVIDAVVHQQRTQTVAHHQTRRHRAIDAHAAGNQILHG